MLFDEMKGVLARLREVLVMEQTMVVLPTSLAIELRLTGR